MYLYNMYMYMQIVTGTFLQVKASWEDIEDGEDEDSKNVRPIT